MTQEQINGYIRTLCTMISTIAGTTGFMTANQANELQTGLLGLVTLVGLGYSVYSSTKAHSQKGLVTSAANVPNTVIVTQPALANAIPSNAVVSNADVNVTAKP